MCFLLFLNIYRTFVYVSLDELYDEKAVFRMIATINISLISFYYISYLFATVFFQYSYNVTNPYTTQHINAGSTQNEK